MQSKAAVQQFVHDAFPLIKRLGIVIETLTAEEVVTRLPEDPFNDNHFKTIYAGVQFSVLEVTGGIIFAAAFDVGRYFIVVKEMTIEYHRPAKGELRAFCRFPVGDREQLLANLASAGKASYVLTMELKDHTGLVVSSARATYFVSPARKNS